MDRMEETNRQGAKIAKEKQRKGFRILDQYYPVFPSEFPGRAWHQGGSIPPNCFWGSRAEGPATMLWAASRMDPPEI